MTTPNGSDTTDTSPVDSAAQVQGLLAAADNADTTSTDQASNGQQSQGGAAEPSAAPIPTPPAGTPQGNPWDSYLAKFPEAVRPIAESTFKEWDAGVTKRIQGLHSEFEPYKELVDGYEPDYLSQAAQLMEALEADPARVVAALTQVYGLGGEQGPTGQQQVQPTAQDGTEEQNPFDSQFKLEEHPQFKQLQQLTETLAQTLLTERQQREQEAADKELDTIITGLRKEHGNFDETYVLNLMAQGVDPADAVKQFQTALTQFASQQNAASDAAPVVVGSDGGYPSQQADLAKLSDKDTKNLVAQMLAQASQQT